MPHSLTRERTRQFPKNQPIDCRRWLEFTIVEETYRYHRIRYRAFDDDAVCDVKFPQPADEPATT